MGVCSVRLHSLVLSVMLDSIQMLPIIITPACYVHQPWQVAAFALLQQSASNANPGIF